ncbi:hypothetical protein X759_32435 [Mesorhizobium sp. LSHC420B00]|uniref:winged helix-turn-helix domain-containing protein n=1 Tax=unclassified Mesorhizobium TaxID=325217 RepID=UPI0003CF6D73|nr:winged helix-turn-helix domain-containing protein [Mesorhizobium sp. LSHC420B00]ESX64096.1 hypothetical protein X759_32435 [Mesorhizobium sp. LSHC420B00]
MKNILIVGQDALTREPLMGFLSKHEFNIRAVENRQLAASNMASEAIDLAIVDLSYGREDGLQFVRDFGAKRDLPIIIISGDFVDEADKVIGLETGARDYITMPFGLTEFRARVRAAMRQRPERDRNTIYRFDDWRVSTKRRSLRRGTDPDVKLTAGEFNLLMAFLKNPGRVLSREQLLMATRVYDQEVYYRSIDVLIVRLRRKLGQDKAPRPQYIRTERGAGYIFDSVVNIEELRTRRG